jgi:predicted RNA binding protein YcfA (HicA-like mRNA interferase family)
MKPARLLERIERGEVANIDFRDLLRLLAALGFKEVAGRGSHRVFARPDVSELVNLQMDKGAVKPYQARQVAALVGRYDLRLEGDE